MKSCPVCNISWEASERIYDHFIREGYKPEEAARVAKMYGDTPETPRHFGISHHGVQYAYGNKNHYDGVSEWNCHGCKSRIGRWSGRILTGDESEPPYGEYK